MSVTSNRQKSKVCFEKKKKKRNVGKEEDGGPFVWYTWFLVVLIIDHHVTLHEFTHCCLFNFPSKQTRKKMSLLSLRSFSSWFCFENKSISLFNIDNYHFERQTLHFLYYPLVHGQHPNGTNDA